MPEHEETTTRSIEFTQESFKIVTDFAVKTNRSFKAAAKTLIEEALAAHAENGK